MSDDKKIEQLLNKKYKNNYRNLKGRIDFDQYEKTSAADSGKSFFSTPWFYGISSLVLAATICAVVIPVTLSNVTSSSSNIDQTPVALTPSTDYTKITNKTKINSFNTFTIKEYDDYQALIGTETPDLGRPTTTDDLLTSKNSHLYDLSSTGGDVKFIATLPNEITENIRLQMKDYTNNVNHNRLAYFLKNYSDTSKVQWYSMSADSIVPSEIDSNQVTAILYDGKIILHEEILSSYEYNFSYTNYYFSDGLITNNAITESKLQNKEYIYYSDSEWAVNSSSYSPSGRVEVVGGFYQNKFYMDRWFYNSSCTPISEFDENMKELTTDSGRVLGYQIDFALFKKTLADKFAEFMYSQLPS